MPSTTEYQTLNQYTGTDALGAATTIVAPDMKTACAVYEEQEQEDATTMQCTKTNIRCVLPEMFVSFETVVYDPSGLADKSCTATPARYTLKAGTKQVFTATPGEGWEFVKWSIDDVPVDTEEGTKAVAMLEIPTSTAPVIIKAEFKQSVGG